MQTEPPCYIAKYAVILDKPFNKIVKWEFVFSIYPIWETFKQHLNYGYLIIRTVKQIQELYNTIKNGDELIHIDYQLNESEFDNITIKNNPQLSTMVGEIYEIFCGKLNSFNYANVDYDTRTEMLSISGKDAYGKSKPVFTQHLSVWSQDTYHKNNLLMHRDFAKLFDMLINENDPKFVLRFRNHKDDVLRIVRDENTIIMQTSDFNKIKFVINTSFSTAMNKIGTHMTTY